MTPTVQPSSSPAQPFEETIAAFVRSLLARNRSAATVRAYEPDLRQFVAFLDTSTVNAVSPELTTRADITEFLAGLGERRVSGVSRARKLAAIREFFRYLVVTGAIDRSPAAGVETPKREKNVRTFLRPDEFNRMLSLAGANVRDYALLQTFLQTGVRVGELCDLRLDDADLEGRVLRVRGKGMVAREVELERKAIAALRNWMTVRPVGASDHLFLNKDGEAFSQRGVRKLVSKYRRLAGITRRASCHSLRHTFATYKAEHGVSAFQLQRWLGHASIATTQIYVHLGKQNAKKVMEATSL